MKSNGLLIIYIFIVETWGEYNRDYENLSRNNGLEFNTKEEGKDFVTWCTTSKAEQHKCENMVNTTILDKALFGDDFIDIKCKQAFDKEECMTWVDKGQASLLALDAGEVYIAGLYHSLIPILQEMYGKGDTFQYSVAVIKKGSLPSIIPGEGLNELRGARGCFPRVGTLAGWVMPIYVLMKQGDLKIVDCNNHVKSAAAYFSASCAPNSLIDMYNPIGDNTDKLCKICVGEKGRSCTPNDPFAGYEGALRCLISDEGGDIAFVKDSTVQHALLSRRIFGGISPENLELLCLDGSRRSLSEWEQCNWGRVPADAIVTSSARSASQIVEYQNFILKLVQLYGEPNQYNAIQNNSETARNRDPFRKQVYSSTEYSGYSGYDPYRRDRDNERRFENDDSYSTKPVSPYEPRVSQEGRPIESFKLFYSNETTDILVQDATISFKILKETEQMAKHILHNELVGELAEQAVYGIRDCPIKRASLCTTSDVEMEKCVKMKIALKTAFLSPSLHCYEGYSAEHCAQAVASGATDMTMADPGDMLRHASVHRLVPFVQEIYSNGNNWYYAVAVAKEQDPDTDITYLRGKNTCHMGISTAAGWIYPLSYLISNGWMRPYSCDGAHAAAEYFSKSCVPGALSATYVQDGATPHDNLCHLCHGAAFRRCRRDASEDYFGSIGAIRCMVEGGGDVAFVAHTALSATVGGRRREWWARDLLPDDLQLLCPDGTRAKIDKYKTCNLGKVPGSVLMGRPNHTELDAYSNLLVYAQQFYGATKLDDFSFSMFYSKPPYSDLIFSDAAVRLKPLSHSSRSAHTVAGAALPRAARVVACDAPAPSALASDPAFLSSGQALRGYALVVVLSLSLALIAS